MECKACGVWFVSDDKSGVCHTCKQTLKNMGLDLQYDRLRELVKADREGRCVVLPVKPGGFVRFAGNSRAKHEKVDAISIYAGGRITFAFHETGMKTRWVDEWSEDESERYVSVESDEAALKEREKNEP